MCAVLGLPPGFPLTPFGNGFKFSTRPATVSSTVLSESYAANVWAPSIGYGTDSFQNVCIRDSGHFGPSQQLGIDSSLNLIIFQQP